MTRNQLATCGDLNFSPLFRSMIGIDRLAQMLDAQVPTSSAGYPPYNIEKTDEDAYRISMAVAGFKREDIDITVESGTLIVSGRKVEDEKAESSVYLHRGIAGRGFEQRFQLADHVEVTDATLEHGMLSISLLRQVPERLKPRKIELRQAAH